MKFLPFFLLLLACGGPIKVASNPDLPVIRSVEAWNRLCHRPLFVVSPGLVRVEWVDDLGEGRFAVARGYLIQVSRKAFADRPDLGPVDLKAVVSHEIGHVLASGDRSGDGYGHYPGGIMAREKGTDEPNEFDRAHLRSLGIKCD